MAKRKRKVSQPTAPPAAGPVSWSARVRTRLRPAAPATVWRVVLAVVTAVLSYWTLAGGTMKFAQGPQVAVVVGLVCALVAPGWVVAGAIASGVCLIGAVTGPASFHSLVNPAQASLALVPWALLAALVAAGVGFAIQKRLVKPDWVLWFAVAMVVVNMWASVVASNQEGFMEARTGLMVPPLIEIMETAKAPDAMRTLDGLYHLEVVKSLEQGQEYYATASALLDRAGEGVIKGPSGILNLRQPGLYWFLALLPGPWWVVGVYLSLVTVGAVGIFGLLKDTVRAPLVLPGVFAVTAWVIPFATTLMIYTSELWAGALALIAFVLFGVSVRSTRWRAWLIASVAVSVLALLVREFAGTLFVAGVLAALVGPSERRRWSITAWAIGLVVAAVGYGAHVVALRPYLTGAPGMEVWGRGGLDFALGALTYNTLAFGVGIAVVLALASYLGAALMPDAGRRAFSLVLLLMPLIVFLFIGNGAVDPLTGGAVNSWGEFFVPCAYACMPVALSLIPGAVPGERG